MTPEEKRRAQAALIFLTEKRDGSIKARKVYNGKPTRQWLSREESASPTASLESLVLLGVIDVRENRDVMCVDIPNAFIQADMPMGPNDKRVIMKITGVLVDYLVDMAPHIYARHVVYERGKRVIYVVVLKAIYGMLVAALLWYKKFRKDLEEAGFEFNPYDPCVANAVIQDEQHTIRFHVDDLMSSHKDPNVNDQFYKWLNAKYGKLGEVKHHRGKVHDYLGMTYRLHNDMLELDMTKYVEEMINEFPVKFLKDDKVKTPATDKLFDDSKGNDLNEKTSQIFHTFVAKGLFVSKRARLDIQPTIAVLCTRVAQPKESDWSKLIKMMRYLNATRDKTRKISATGNLSVIKWMVDAAFAVHPDFMSHTGAVMMYDGAQGVVQAISRKQKLNTRSSTEAELVAVDDVATMVLWTKLFLEAQGWVIKKNIIYQDNKSAILLEVNGKKSSGKRT